MYRITMSEPLTKSVPYCMSELNVTKVSTTKNEPHEQRVPPTMSEPTTQRVLGD